MAGPVNITGDRQLGRRVLATTGLIP